MTRYKFYIVLYCIVMYEVGVATPLRCMKYKNAFLIARPAPFRRFTRFRRRI